MELEHLVEKFRQKDKNAFQRIYEMYHQSMHGVVYTIVRNQEIAEEVVQDVFIKPWNNAESYSPEKGRIFTWLLNISRNAAIDKVRSKSYTNANQNTSFFVDIVESNDNFDAKIDLDRIKDLVKVLKDKCIKLIELLYFKGYTQIEVSEELNIPLGTVKTNNRNCISELRNKLVD